MHSFNAYSIKVYDKILPGEVKDKYHVLSSIRGKNITSYFNAFIKTLEKAIHIDTKEKRTLKISSFKETKDSIYGWIEYGEFGVSGKIFDVNTGKHKYTKSHEDSDSVELYFQIRVPAGSKIGYILFHTIGTKGVKQAFSDKFNDYFKSQTAGLVTQIKPLAHEKTIVEWLNNSIVKEFKLRNVSIKSNSTDIADELGEIKTEYLIKPDKKGGSFGTFGKLSNRTTSSGAGFLEYLSDISQDISTVVESGGRKKTIKMSSGAPVASIEIAEDNVAFKDGMPEADSLHSFADHLMKEFMQQG